MGIETDNLINLCRQKGLKYVGTRGNTKSPVCVTGEAPGANEDQEGFPFVGYSGQEQNRMLKEAGFSQSEVWFTNPYKVRPPDNDINKRSELGIPEELYIKQFLEELYENKPTIIITAGATSLAILNPATRIGKNHHCPIGKWRGSLLQSPHLNWPHWIIPVQHPAFILRDWSERQITVFCYVRAFEELRYYQKYSVLQPLPQRQLITQPSYETLMEYLLGCETAKALISVDIELLRRKYIYALGIATSPFSAISFVPWNYDNPQRVKLFRCLDRIFRNIPQVGQNYLGFDIHWLSLLGFSVPPCLVDDTMVMHHVLYPEFSHKLEFMGMQFTREPYWKDEGHSWKKSDGLDKLLRYNALDAAATFEIYEKMKLELEQA